MMSRNTLLHQCIKLTGENFAQVLQATNSKSEFEFSSLPEDVQDKLLSYMLSIRTLTKEHLRTFLSPTRRHLALDDGAWLTGDIFTTVADYSANLQSLSLASCAQLTTAHLSSILLACKDLTAISLQGCTLLDDTSLHVIADNSKNLIYLDLFGVSKITNKGIQYFAQSEAAKKLEFLSLAHCMKLGNVALDALALLPCLRELSLNTCPLISSNGLVPFANGPAGKSIIALDISHCGGILDPGLLTIANLMPQMRTLQLTGMIRISVAGIDAIARQCTSLESLSIKQCKQLTNDSVATILTHCTNLSVLDISFLEQVTDDAFVNMPPMPSLVSLFMVGAKGITDVAIKKIAPNVPNLQVWSLWKCHNISDEGVIAIGNNCHLLTYIQLTECSKTSNKGVKELALGCPLLTTVLLGGYATVTDEGIKVLTTHCKQIRTIDLGGLIAITNHSLRYLGESLPNLYSVTLYDCKSVTEDGIHSLVGASPTLQRLDMGGKTGMTSQQIAHISSRYKNRYLKIASD